MESDFVTVFRSAGTTAELQALSVKALLDAAGIEAMIVGTPTMPNLPEEVRVAKDDVTEAKRLIADALEAGPEAALEAEKLSEAE